MTIKKAIISGATGFLGEAILAHLLKLNIQPFVLLRYESDTQNIDQYLKDCTCIRYKSLKDETILKELESARKADFFFHCAWSGVGKNERNLCSQITYNLELTTDTVILADKLKCKKWIGIGSQAEYGVPNEKATENATPINPVTIYGKLKVASYWAASGLCQHFEIPMLWCRVFSLYGRHDHLNNLIPYVIQECFRESSPALTNCEQEWDYLHVNDGAKAIIQLAMSNARGIFNIGSGKTIKLRKVVEYIKKNINSNVIIGYGVKSYSSDQILFLKADIKKLKDSINWEPEIEIKQGLSDLIEYYRTTKFKNESI